MNQQISPILKQAHALLGKAKKLDPSLAEEVDQIRMDIRQVLDPAPIDVSKSSAEQNALSARMDELNAGEKFFQARARTNRLLLIAHEARFSYRELGDLFGISHENVRARINAAREERERESETYLDSAMRRMFDGR